MSGQLICRAGACLPREQLRRFDSKTGSIVAVDWSRTGKPFGAVRYAMVQAMASGSGDHNIKELTPISDQGQAGSCVANGCSDMFEMLMGLDGHSVVQLSRRWLYYVSRAYHGAQNVDHGTFIAAAMHQLQTLGTFEEKYFPYSDDPDHITGDKSHPGLSCYTMATENRIQDFYWLDTTSPTFLDDAEVAIRADHPAVLAVQIGQEWQAYRGEDRVFDAPSASLGGHCMIVSGVGYEGGKRFWRLRNSWTAGWGDQGHGRISDSYFQSASEVCVGTKMAAAA